MSEIEKILRLSGDLRRALAEANQLRDQLIDLYLDGKYREALPLAKKELEIRRETLGEEDTEYATSLNNLALIYDSLGERNIAEPLCRQAVEINKRNLGEQHPIYALSLNALGEIAEELGKYDEAESVYLKALHVRKNAFGDKDDAYAASLTSLGLLYEDRGEYEKAERLLREALTIRESALPSYRYNYEVSLNNLGTLYTHTGRYGDAVPLLAKAMDTARIVYGPRHPEYAIPVNNLGILYEEMGRYEEAEPLLREALEIRKVTLGEQHPDYATSLNNLGTLYYELGRYEQAEDFYARALDIRKVVLGEDDSEYVSSLNNLAELYSEEGKYEQAEQLYRQALNIRKRVLQGKGLDYALSLNNLGIFLQRRGKYDEAEPLIQQALEIRETTLGEKHPLYATTLSNLGTLYSDLGLDDKAISAQRRAMDLLGPESVDYPLVLENLGIELAKARKFQESSQLLLRSAETEWKYLTLRFPSMSSKQKREFLNKREFGQSNALYNLVFHEDLSDKSVGLRAALLSKQLLFESARQENHALLAVVSAASPTWQALWRRRETLREQYSTLALEATSNDDPNHLPQNTVDQSYMISLDRELETIEQKLRASNPAYARRARLEEVALDDVANALRTSDALLEYVHYRSYDFKGMKWGGWRYGVFVLSGRATLKAMDLGDAEPIEQSVSQLRLKMNEFLEAFSSGDIQDAEVGQWEASIDEIASRLRELVWDPVERELKDVSRTYVAPDGELDLLPFEVMAKRRGDGQWRYLAEDVEFVYLGTGRDLVRFAADSSNERSAKKTAVLIGNPNFHAEPREIAEVVARWTSPSKRPPLGTEDSTSRSSLGAIRLSGSYRGWTEVPELANLLNRAQTDLQMRHWSVRKLENIEANEEAATRLKAPRILQFATHGETDVQSGDSSGWSNPLLHSTLILAGADSWQPEKAVFFVVGNKLLDEKEAKSSGLKLDELRKSRLVIKDGFLTAYDVTGLNLEGTELVNLTACQTALGQVSAEGVAGLRQAFILAGARSLTMSMWEIPVKETIEQIGRFYDRWLDNTKQANGTTRYEAFRWAQLEALRQARQRYKSGHPFYWAGTVYLGDPGDLPRKRPENNGR